MSTTRWIIETPCEHDYEGGLHATSACWAHDGVHKEADDCYCDGNQRTVVDPDNLPPERVERATPIVRECQEVMRQWVKGNETGSLDATVWALAVITAFLSDPEPGDQT